MPTGINLKELIKENILLEMKDLDIANRAKKLQLEFADIEGLETIELLTRLKGAVKSLFEDAEGIEKIFFKLALRLDKAGLYEEAIFYYRLSNLLSPNESAINNLAVVYSEIGREPEAVKILKEGLEIFKESNLLRENLETLQGQK